MEESSDGAGVQRQVLETTLRETAFRQDQETQLCVICLDVLSDPCEPLPCGHRNFDNECLDEWLKQSSRCPLCQTMIFPTRATLSDGPPRPSFVPSPNHQRTLPESLSGQQVRPPVPFPRVVQDEVPWSVDPRRSVTASDRDEVAIVTFRRALYREQLFSAHVGTNRRSAHIELTPALFVRHIGLVRRARMFIRRELQLFSFLTLDDSVTIRPQPRDMDDPRQAVYRSRARNSEFIIEYIIGILKSVDIMGSGGQAEEMVSEYLGRRNARLFLHELRAWLRSPYRTLEEWDSHVQYPRLPRGFNEDPRGTGQIFPRRPVTGGRRRRRDNNMTGNDDAHGAVSALRLNDEPARTDTLPRETATDRDRRRRHARPWMREISRSRSPRREREDEDSDDDGNEVQ